MAENPVNKEITSKEETEAKESSKMNTFSLAECIARELQFVCQRFNLTTVAKIKCVVHTALTSLGLVEISPDFAYPQTFMVNAASDTFIYAVAGDQERVIRTHYDFSRIGNPNDIAYVSDDTIGTTILIRLSEMELQSFLQNGTDGDLLLRTETASKIYDPLFRLITKKKVLNTSLIRASTEAKVPLSKYLGVTPLTIPKPLYLSRLETELNEAITRIQNLEMQVNAVVNQNAQEEQYVNQF